VKNAFDGERSLLRRIWKLAVGTRLTLTPESASRNARNFSKHHGGEKDTVDTGGPRSCGVMTLVLEYSRNQVSCRVDGIERSGPTAPWYYSPDGLLSIVLRRAGERLAK
jgi:hypothetical protein